MASTRTGCLSYRSGSGPPQTRPAFHTVPSNHGATGDLQQAWIDVDADHAVEAVWERLHHQAGARPMSSNRRGLRPGAAQRRTSATSPGTPNRHPETSVSGQQPAPLRPVTDSEDGIGVE